MAVCISDARGVRKKDVRAARLLIGWGVEGDAHGGDWHRQVSLLSYDKIKSFNEKGAGVCHGDFGENIVVGGLDLGALPVGTELICGDCVLTLTQIGKECHSHCRIYHEMGDCIMPREGVFARVTREGLVAAGDVMEARIPAVRPRTAAVVTLSDRASRGERADESGAAAARLLEDAGYTVISRSVLPDERAAIEAELIDLADRRQADLIVTTGGTGFSRRDVTPEATLAVAGRAAPGVAEAIRAYSMTVTGRAMLSRGVSVIRGGALIVNLPGSPGAVRESLAFALPHLAHGIEVLRGDAGECARA